MVVVAFSLENVLVFRLRCRDGGLGSEFIDQFLDLWAGLQIRRHCSCFSYQLELPTITCDMTHKFSFVYPVRSNRLNMYTQSQNNMNHDTSMIHSFIVFKNMGPKSRQHSVIFTECPDINIFIGVQVDSLGFHTHGGGGVFVSQQYTWQLQCSGFLRPLHTLLQGLRVLNAPSYLRSLKKHLYRSGTVTPRSIVVTQKLYVLCGSSK